MQYNKSNNASWLKIIAIIDGIDQYWDMGNNIPQRR